MKPYTKSKKNKKKQYFSQFKGGATTESSTSVALPSSYMVTLSNELANFFKTQSTSIHSTELNVEVTQVDGKNYIVITSTSDFFLSNKSLVVGILSQFYYYLSLLTSLSEDENNMSLLALIIWSQSQSSNNATIPVVTLTDLTDSNAVERFIQLKDKDKDILEMLVSNSDDLSSDDLSHDDLSHGDLSHDDLSTTNPNIVWNYDLFGETAQTEWEKNLGNENDGNSRKITAAILAKIGEVFPSSAANSSNTLRVMDQSEQALDPDNKVGEKEYISFTILLDENKDNTEDEQVWGILYLCFLNALKRNFASDPQVNNALNILIHNMIDNKDFVAIFTKILADDTESNSDDVSASASASDSAPVSETVPTPTPTPTPASVSAPDSAPDSETVPTPTPASASVSAPDSESVPNPTPTSSSDPVIIQSLQHYTRSQFEDLDLSQIDEIIDQLSKNKSNVSDRALKTIMNPLVTAIKSRVDSSTSINKEQYKNELNNTNKSFASISQLTSADIIKIFNIYKQFLTTISSKKGGFTKKLKKKITKKRQKNKNKKSNKNKNKNKKSKNKRNK